MIPLPLCGRLRSRLGVFQASTTFLLDAISASRAIIHHLYSPTPIYTVAFILFLSGLPYRYVIVSRHMGGDRVPPPDLPALKKRDVGTPPQGHSSTQFLHLRQPLHLSTSFLIVSTSITRQSIFLPKRVLLD